MNRFPDMFQTVIDRDLFGMNTLTRRLTNSGCIAQALLGTGKLVANGQTIMKAMRQQLQSNLCVAAAKDGARAEQWTHMRSKMPARRK